MIAVDAIVMSGQRSASSVATNEISLLISGPPDALRRRQMEDLAVAVCSQARKRGWKACAGWKDDAVKVRLQNGDPSLVREFVQIFSGSAEEFGARMSIHEEEEASPSICALEDAPIVWGTVVQARLTRDLLCGLPEGAFVASASEDDRVHSIGRLGPFHVRAQQWQRAQLSGLDGGMCRVFWSEADYNAFVNPD